MRCWLVLMAEDQVGALRYQQGDVVAVHPPEAHDGDVRRNPVHPPWWLISVPLSVEEARALLKEEFKRRTERAQWDVHSGAVVDDVVVRLHFCSGCHQSPPRRNASQHFSQHPTR